MRRCWQFEQLFWLLETRKELPQAPGPMSHAPIHSITKGFDIRLSGAPDPARHFDAADPLRVGATLGAIPGLEVRPLVRVGDVVQRGQPVLAFRSEARIFALAPAAGQVIAVLRGSERISACVEISRDGSETRTLELDLPDVEAIETADRDTLIAQLRVSGLWPLIRERPIGGTPLSGPPQALFINAMDTEPLAADPAVLLQGRTEDFKQGLAVLRRLTDGPVYLCVSGDKPPLPFFDELDGLQVHQFRGPHPSGLPGTHINRIAPLRADSRYWTIRAQDLIRIGECLRTRSFPSHRVIALAGPHAKKPGYYRVHEGCPLSAFSGDVPSDCRVLQGSVLNAFQSSAEDYLAATVHTVTIIGEGHGKRDLLGWLRAKLDHPSSSRSSFSWLRRRPSYSIDARLHGEARPIVNIGMWEKVMPLDVHLSSLVRAVQAEDLEEALALGLLDLTEEDVALCSYRDPCKLDVGAVIRKGLDLYASEKGSG